MLVFFVRGEKRKTQGKTSQNRVRTCTSTFGTHELNPLLTAAKGIEAGPH